MCYSGQILCSIHSMSNKYANWATTVALRWSLVMHTGCSVGGAPTGAPVTARPASVQLGAGFFCGVLFLLFLTMEIDERPNIKFLVKLAKFMKCRALFVEITHWRKRLFSSESSLSVRIVKTARTMQDQDDRRPPVLKKTLNVCGLLCFPIVNLLSGWLLMNRI